MDEKDFPNIIKSDPMSVTNMSWMIVIENQRLTVIQKRWRMRVRVSQTNCFLEIVTFISIDFI